MSDDSYVAQKDILKAIRERIHRRQSISQAAWEKFAADAKTERDPLKKSTAENLAAIHFDISSMWEDIEMLHTAEIVNTEKINQLYRFIFALPEVIKNKELSDRMMEEYSKLNDESFSSDRKADEENQ